MCWLQSIIAWTDFGCTRLCTVQIFGGQIATTEMIHLPQLKPISTLTHEEHLSGLCTHHGGLCNCGRDLLVLVLLQSTECRCLVELIQLRGFWASSISSAPFVRHVLCILGGEGCMSKPVLSLSYAQGCSMRSRRFGGSVFLMMVTPFKRPGQWFEEGDP